MSSGAKGTPKTLDLKEWEERKESGLRLESGKQDRSRRPSRRKNLATHVY